MLSLLLPGAGNGISERTGRKGRTLRVVARLDGQREGKLLRVVVDEGDVGERGPSPSSTDSGGIDELVRTIAAELGVLAEEGDDGGSTGDRFRLFLAGTNNVGRVVSTRAIDDLDELVLKEVVDRDRSEGGDEDEPAYASAAEHEEEEEEENGDKHVPPPGAEDREGVEQEAQNGTAVAGSGAAATAAAAAASAGVVALGGGAATSPAAAGASSTTSAPDPFGYVGMRVCRFGRVVAHHTGQQQRQGQKSWRVMYDGQKDGEGEDLDLEELLDVLVAAEDNADLDPKTRRGGNGDGQGDPQGDGDDDDDNDIVDNDIVDNDDDEDYEPPEWKAKKGETGSKQRSSSPPRSQRRGWKPPVTSFAAAAAAAAAADKSEPKRKAKKRKTAGGEQSSCDPPRSQQRRVDLKPAVPSFAARYAASAAAALQTTMAPMATPEEMDAVYQLCRGENWRAVLRCIREKPYVATTPMIVPRHEPTTVMHEAIVRQAADDIGTSVPKSRANDALRADVIRTILEQTPKAACMRNGFGSLPLQVIRHKRIMRHSKTTKEGIVRALIDASKSCPGGAI